MNQPFDFYKSAITFRDGFEIRSFFWGGNGTSKVKPEIAALPFSFPIAYSYSGYILHIPCIQLPYTLTPFCIYQKTNQSSFSTIQTIHHIPCVYLPSIFLGRTLDVPWTYEQFLTKLFVTSSRLSIVNNEQSQLSPTQNFQLSLTHHLLGIHLGYTFPIPCVQLPYIFNIPSIFLECSYLLPTFFLPSSYLLFCIY